MESTETLRKFLKAYWWDERDRIRTDYMKGLPPPESQKSYPDDMPLIGLVPPESISTGTIPLIDAFKRRKSHRKFTDAPLSMEELSFLVWSTQGMRDPGMMASVSRRTVPSAGARHPFETYLVVNQVTDLEPGLYRYLPLDHSLIRLRTKPASPGKVSDACRGQDFVGRGAVVFIWTVIPYRAEWRYSMVAPKMIALDAGHLCQNLYLASEAIGAGTCAIGAYDQDKMDALLEVDGKEEFVIYAAPVGKT
jgi:SagB-type dehydrogenase family enzyme